MCGPTKTQQPQSSNALNDLAELPHRRYNPLSGTHVLVSPHRAKRPWKGQVDEPSTATLPKHTKDCYLCPGNDRMGGNKNPDFETTYVFPNDFPALLDPSASAPFLANDRPVARDPTSPSSDLFSISPTFGTAKVITYSPRHDLTLALMGVPEIREVVRTWTEVYVQEGKAIREGHREAGGQSGAKDEGCVNIFENRGSMMGASAPHPHGQVWSTSFVPEEPSNEIKHLTAYSKTHGRCLLCDYAQQEVEKGDRVVLKDEESGWVAVVPFWATWPFEIMVLPYKRHITSLVSLTEEEALGLSRVLKAILIRYDNLFKTSFPYSMGLHQSPLPPSPEQESASPAHFHMHFYPPLLRSASVRKFLVGFEMLAEAQRDLTPEQAAGQLRDLPASHYLDSKVGS